jgi:hypothetical protein
VPGQVFTISAAMKTLAGVQADAQLMFLDANKSYISGLQPTNSSGSWVVASVTGAAPANTAFVRVSLQCNAVGGGTVYFDAVRVRANFRPYLDLPRGRQGSIDPLSKKLTQGALSIRVMDKRTTVGGSNANRWVTAFLGDANGKQRLIGCKILLEESLDGG